MHISPDNHSHVLYWLLAELHGGNAFSQSDYWNWMRDVWVTSRIAAQRDFVAVDMRRLRIILDYLHETEADHYDPEGHPEDVTSHVYTHVIAIEGYLKALHWNASRAAGVR